MAELINGPLNVCAENVGKSIVLRKYLEEVSLNNITRITFGKRFMSSEGKLDEQGLEFSAIGTEGRKIGASLTLAEHIPWLRWMFSLEEEALAQISVRRNRLTRAIMEEHTLTRLRSGGAKQHFVDALLTLQHQYDLTEENIIGLLWVSIIIYIRTLVFTFKINEKIVECKCRI